MAVLNESDAGQERTVHGRRLAGEAQALSRQMRLVGVPGKDGELGETLVVRRGEAAKPLEADDPLERLRAVPEGGDAAAKQLPLAQPDALGKPHDTSCALSGERGRNGGDRGVRRSTYATCDGILEDIDRLPRRGATGQQRLEPLHLTPPPKLADADSRVGESPAAEPEDGRRRARAEADADERARWKGADVMGPCVRAADEEAAATPNELDRGVGKKRPRLVGASGPDGLDIVQQTGSRRPLAKRFASGCGCGEGRTNIRHGSSISQRS